MYGDYIHLDSELERSQSAVVGTSDQHGSIGFGCSSGGYKYQSLGSGFLTLCGVSMLHNDDPCPVSLMPCRRLVDPTISHGIATLSR